MKTYLQILFLFMGMTAFSQNEFAKWYFGRYTGLDFMNNPPSVINHTTLNTFEGSASAADGAGNLLFYTDGSTVWNKQQLVMANGTGLFGNGSTVQSALIVKQPGNTNIYFVFTLDAQGATNGLRYSLVDMNLAAGMGSVTAKNIPIATPCTEQLSGTRHCNGIDMWILTHDFNSVDFKSFLLTSSGLNLTPVVSSVGPAPPTYTPNNTVTGQGTLKFSPSGKKLGFTFFNGSNNSEVAIFDFDKSSGLVSNYLSLITGSVNYYGCEFSGDGTKFYSATSTANPPTVYQWNLCAGSNSLIMTSKTTVGNPSATSGQLQLAPNGKIYIVAHGSQSLSAINNPDMLGSSCNYTSMALSVATGSNGAALPNFIGGVYKNLPSFTYTLSNCSNASFMAPPSLATVCASVSYSVQSISWNFGQASTGAANTSTLLNPTHNYGTSGTYQVKLIFNNQCGADTVYQNITIPAGPTIAVQSKSICAKTNATLTASGASSYTWSPGGNTGSVSVVSPSVTQIYTVSGSYTNGCSSNVTTTLTVLKCTSLPTELENRSILKIYPNPISSELFVESEEQIEIIIYDLAGREIVHQQLEIGTNTIKMDEFESGIYFLRTPGNRNHTSGKIVKLE